MQLSSIELRTLVAAQIASGLVGQVAPDSPQTAIDGVAHLAVRIGKTLREGAIKSMHRFEAYDLLAQLTSDYPPTERRHMTTVYSKELNAPFVSDLGYNHVHFGGTQVIGAHRQGYRGEYEPAAASTARSA